MSRRSIVVQDIPTTTPNQFVRMELYYDQGGISMMTGSAKRRGFYLSAGPIKKEGDCISFTLFSSTAKLIEETPRFNEKKLRDRASTIKTHPNYQVLLDHVVAKNQLTLAPETAPAAEPVAA